MGGVMNVEKDLRKRKKMIGYINAIKRGFRDQHGIIPTGGTIHEPLFEHIPDGEYPMEIDGKVDKVKIINGTINCCNFDK